MIEVARDFAASDGFVPALARLETPLTRFARALSEAAPTDAGALEALIERVFGVSTADLVERVTYAEDRRRIADSLIALTLLHRERAPEYDELLQGARLCRLLDRAAMQDPTLAAEDAVSSALAEMVILPSSVFPLAPDHGPGAALGDGITVAGETTIHELGPVQREPNGPETSAMAVTSMHRFAALRTAVDELASLTATDFRSEPAPAAAELQTAGAARSRAQRRPRAAPPPTREAWLLSESGVRHLSETTRAEIARLGPGFESRPVPEISRALELEMARLATDVYGAASTVEVVPIGTTFVPVDALMPAAEPLFGVIGTVVWPFLTVPQEGAFRELGIADLEVVKEEIRRYEFGEIAHIENVLKGEDQERTHRRLQRTEETYLTEEETTEATERDLQSTERFELQRETQESVREESSFDVGVTLKYGGFVDVEASTNYATKNASELSTRAASTYARETIDRSVSRIQERVREQRVRTTVLEIEEKSLHKLDNTAQPAGHVVGVYRWVDKVHDAQIRNYGKRTMYEFIVPEPAVFALFARAKTPPKGVTLQEPRPPTFGPSELFWDAAEKKWIWKEVPEEPLRPEHIQWWNYHRWVAQYQADVEPPPAQYIKKAFTWQSPKLQGAARPDAELAWEGTTTKVPIDRDYAAVKAHVHAGQESGFSREETFIVVEVGEHVEWYSASGSDTNGAEWKFELKTLGVAGVEGEVPVAVTAVHGSMITVVAEILCERTERALAKWRQKAYTAIVTAYRDLKAAYDEQLGAALNQMGIAISGRNPGLNREVEQTELKRGTLSLLMRRWWPHLEAVGSVVLNKQLYPANAAATADFPELDFQRANKQAPVVQFLEQAFEWTHMLYTFYPYFWARKSTWPLLQQLEDTDPIHARFLRAGAARVLVPVRPGYEASLRHYWLTGEPWQGDGPPSTIDDRYLPVIEEIKEKYGIDFEHGAGTLSVTDGSAVVTASAEARFSADDVNREIRFSGKTYRIVAVAARQRQITLDEPYAGPTRAEVPYAISGYRLVGDPWEVKLPTTLVYLQQDAQLPAFPPA
jgi:hypothetical protein